MSRLSRPSLSISSLLSAMSAISFVIFPLPITSAKSRTRLSRRFAIRGVPLERFAISIAPLLSQGMESMTDERITISQSSSGVYISRRIITPNLSRRGPVSCPALVVAPISVNLFRSTLIDWAEGPFPIIISSTQSSRAG